MDQKNNTWIKILSLVVLIVAVSLLTKFIYIQNSITSCEKKTMDFLSWYENNFVEIQHLQDAILKNGDDGFYEVDSIAKEEYVRFWRTNTYFSDVFLNLLTVYLNETGRSLTSAPQDDGPVAGLSGDLILLTQDTDSFFEQENEVTVSKDSTGKYTAIINNGNLVYYLNESCELENIGSVDFMFY